MGSTVNVVSQSDGFDDPKTTVRSDPVCGKTACTGVVCCPMSHSATFNGDAKLSIHTG